MLDPTAAPGTPARPLDQNTVTFADKKKLATVDDVKNAQITQQPDTYTGLNSDDVTKHTGFDSTPLGGGGTTVVIQNPDGGDGGVGGGGITGAAGFGAYTDSGTGTSGLINYNGVPLYALNASGVLANPGSYYPNSLFLFAYGTTDSCFVIRLGQ